MKNVGFPHVSGYEIIDKVGAGSFSVVYKAYTKESGSTGKDVVAIKCIDKRYQKKSFGDNVVKEISLLKYLKHDHIVKLIDFIWDTKYIFIITEYCDEGDLSRYIRKKHKLAEPLVKSFMQQLALAIQFLCNLGICHMDLKPQNLLLCSKPQFKLKIADFGLAQIISPENAEQNRFAGSLLYMAPEKLLNQKFDSRVDLWSIGIIMYECLFGRPPFVNFTTKAIMDVMCKRLPIELPPNVNISSSCENLLLTLLKHDPSERISFENFFAHEFLDLHHIASPENYATAVRLMEEAVMLYDDKQYGKCLAKCNEAVSFLEGFISCETDLSKKAALTLKLNEYVQWTSTLNDLIDGTAGAKKDLPHPLPLKDDHYELLRDLAHVTPNIATGLDIGNTGQLYLAEGRNDLALEKLTTALSILIPLLQTEPAGPRKNMLYSQIQNWLSMAESLKKES